MVKAYFLWDLLHCCSSTCWINDNQPVSNSWSLDFWFNHRESYIIIMCLDQNCLVEVSVVIVLFYIYTEATSLPKKQVYFRKKKATH